MALNANQRLILDLVVDIPDYPEPGVVFKDITPLLASTTSLDARLDALVARAPPRVDVVVGMEARGFILAAPVALALGAGFVPVRKAGKLPGDVYAEHLALEYGHETLEINTDASCPAPGCWWSTTCWPPAAPWVPRPRWCTGSAQNWCTWRC